MDVVTEAGSARLTWHGDLPAAATGLLLLGHGAGGGIGAPDLLLIAGIAHSCGMAVGLTEQPYRVAGRRAPAPAAALDVAFAAVAAAARAELAAGAAIPLVTGGRSSGARVACRTAGTLGARGVLALAFPLQPPRRTLRQAPSRLPELVGAGVPVLVVQGERDAFGTAADLAQAVTAATSPDELDIVISPAAGADHSLRKGIDGAHVRKWLERFLR